MHYTQIPVPDGWLVVPDWIIGFPYLIIFLLGLGLFLCFLSVRFTEK